MRNARRPLALLAFLWLAACASLPPPVDKPHSAAFAAPEATRLGKLVETTAPNGKVSGFRLLISGEDALESLLALADHAQRSLDIQYYIVRNDASSRTVMRHVYAAAGRGVRVRMLVDDLNTAAADESLLCLTRHRNIELRLYNPFPSGRFSTMTRVLTSLTDVSRVNQRMHAKMFVADAAMAATGGRNIGDEYFLRSPSSNFVDLDILAAGPVVRALSRSFDRFWNDELAYPIAQLVTVEPECAGPVSATPQPGRGEETAAAGAAPADAGLSEAPDSGSADARVAGDVSEVDSGGGKLARELADQRLDLRWVEATVVADSPAKIVEAARRSQAAADLADTSAAGTNSMTPSSAGTRSITSPSLAGTDSITSPTSTAGGAVAAELARLIGSAQRELVIVTPYFVPGPHGMAAFRTLRERGVAVRVLTNSLASTDAPLVHIGYARYRSELLELGVELHELRRQLGAPRSRLGSFGSSLASLHAKALVIDRHTSLIGSMNMDPRSVWLNSELAIVIPDDAIASQLLDLYDEVVEQSSYRLRLDDDGNLQWIGGEPGAPRVEGREPGASLGVRALLFLLAPFAPDEML